MESEYTLDERLQIVVAAAQVFGKPRAKELWRAFGLPEIGLDQTHLDLSAFVEEMLEPAAGGIVFARSMYNAYVAWCEARGEKPVCEKAFGIHLPRNGVMKLRKRIREYRGVQLKAAESAWSHRQPAPSGDLATKN